jgi:hypothetical protein
MEPSKAIKEYKEAHAKLVVEVGEYAKKVESTPLPSNLHFL